jgi:hypothetical protein
MGGEEIAYQDVKLGRPRASRKELNEKAANNVNSRMNLRKYVYVCVCSPTQNH